MRENWLLNCPAPEGGILWPGCYDAGGLLEDERDPGRKESFRMQILSDVTEKDFGNYRAAMGAPGHSVGHDRFFSFDRQGRHYHVRWLPKRGEIRICEDVGSCAPESFGYSCQGPYQPELFQYALYYDPDNHMTPRTANCGMLYILRLSDNSLFMIDGGFHLQWSEEAAAGLWRFLKKITGEDKIRISCWYITHTHADHIDGCLKLLSRHHEDIALERLMFNFPHYDVLGSYEDSIIVLRELVKKWYPDLKALKPHTGQQIRIADMDIQVLYTHEDAVEKEDITRFPLRDGNCMSSVLRLTLGGKTVMMLGDTNLETEALLEKYADPTVWKSDMVQVAHHCFNYLDTLYEWIAAPAAIVPNSYDGAHQPENAPKMEAVKKHITMGRMWYEGACTVGLIPTEEGWIMKEQHPLIGGPYDFSPRVK